MTRLRYRRHTRIAAPAEEVFSWHARPGALERLTPPWEQVTVESRTGGVEPGERVVLDPTGLVDGAPVKEAR